MTLHTVRRHRPVIHSSPHSGFCLSISAFPLTLSLSQFPPCLTLLLSHRRVIRCCVFLDYSLFLSFLFVFTIYLVLPRLHCGSRPALRSDLLHELSGLSSFDDRVIGPKNFKYSPDLHTVIGFYPFNPASQCSLLLLFLCARVVQGTLSYPGKYAAASLDCSPFLLHLFTDFIHSLLRSFRFVSCGYP